MPKPGQVDFTDMRYCPVVNTVVTNGDKVLLVQRSSELRLYPGFWNGISGFLDDNRDVEEKVKEELSEELGIEDKNIVLIERGQPLLQEASEYSKTWLVVPMHVEVDTKDFTLDWEARDAKWFSFEEAKKLKLLPGFINVLEQFV